MVASHVGVRLGQSERLHRSAMGKSTGAALLPRRHGPNGWVWALGSLVFSHYRNRLLFLERRSIRVQGASSCDQADAYS